MFNFAGIKRHTLFSPNHRGNDDAIFTQAAKELVKKGCTVNFYTEEEFLNTSLLPEEYIFTMARNKKTVKKLKQAEMDGKFVINSGYGIESCYRTNMTLGLLENKVPYPKSIIVPTDNVDEAALKGISCKTFWIKRGDFHAIHKEDVSFAQSVSHAMDILNEYSLRGIKEAVVSAHLYGDLVKFYGVRNSPFFYWFYPEEYSHTKFNIEAVNGAAHYYSFDENLLKQHGRKAAESLDVYIYGGDAVIAPNGDITIIDLNDWPSFAPCRNEAAVYIADCIYEQAVNHSQLIEKLMK